MDFSADFLLRKSWLIWIGDGNDIGYTALRFILFWNAAALASHLPPSTNLAWALHNGEHCLSVLNKTCLWV